MQGVLATAGRPELVSAGRYWIAGCTFNGNPLGAPATIRLRSLESFALGGSSRLAAVPFLRRSDLASRGAVAPAVAGLPGGRHGNGDAGVHRGLDREPRRPRAGPQAVAVVVAAGALHGARLRCGVLHRVPA